MDSILEAFTTRVASLTYGKMSLTQIKKVTRSAPYAPERNFRHVVLRPYTTLTVREGTSKATVEACAMSAGWV